MNIVLLGPQGSGKGTQAHLLIEKLGLYYFEAGSFLREVAKQDPAIDQLVNKEGKLVDDETMTRLITAHFAKEEVTGNILFDGFPRTLNQYHILETILSGLGQTINCVVLLTLSEAETIRRLSARRIDSKTGITYNLVTNPPPTSVDPANLITREDDQPERIKARLAVYHEKTAPLIALARERGLLIEINGEQAIEAIHEQIIAGLREKGLSA